MLPVQRSLLAHRDRVCVSLFDEQTLVQQGPRGSPWGSVCLPPPERDSEPTGVSGAKDMHFP